MSSANSRFTAWLSEPERTGLHELAVELGSSDNYVLRSALRVLLGMPVSPWARELVARRVEPAQGAADPFHDSPPSVRVSA